MKTQTIMFLGSGSDVGKTLLTAGILRLLKQKGLNVAPFKAQNMSSNAFVTKDGYCLSRAQAMQAEAAYVKLCPEMNPILLKPNSNNQSELFVLGKSWGIKTITEYYSLKTQLKNLVIESLEKLKKIYDLIVIEGAGSCVEINLKEFDLVNLGLAKSINSPFILVTDIDRGGVFAQAVGCKTLFNEKELNLFKGLVVNKFRGDPKMFKTGELLLEELTEKPLLGVIPFLENLLIEPEDSLNQDFILKNNPQLNKLNIAIIDLPFKGDLSDLNSLSLEKDIAINLIKDLNNINDYDYLMLPPGANLESLLNFYKENENALKNIPNEIGILFIGNAYPLIFKDIKLKDKNYKALNLIKEDIEITILDNPKYIEDKALGENICGYQTLAFLNNKENYITFEKNIIASPIIGLFSETKFRNKFLNILRTNKNLPTQNITQDTNKDLREKQYDIWAEHINKHFDLNKFLKVIDL